MRRNDREVQDGAGIQRILEVAKVLRLGLADGNYSYIIPLRYGYAYAGDVLRFHVYGVKEGKKLALMMSNPHAFVELDCGVEMMGEGDIACVYGTNYASLMARGEVAMAEDPEEKTRGLKLPVRAQTGRDFEITAQRATSIAMFRFDAESYGARERKKK